MNEKKNKQARKRSTPRSPTAVDAHVGMRMRVRRMLLGISQENMSARLGLTFQQVQKYERGDTRISAGRLYEIAQLLSVPIAYFFEDLRQEDAQAAGASPTAVGVREAGAEPLFHDFLTSSEGLRLARFFLGIQEPQVRRQVLALLRALGAPDKDAPPL